MQIGEKMFLNMGELILFGAGKCGKRALVHFGRERVACFCDNNRALINEEVDGIRVVSFDEVRRLINEGKKFYIVISVENKIYRSEIVAQLVKSNIYNYFYFHEEISMNFLEDKKRYKQSNISKREKVLSYIEKSCTLGVLDGVDDFLRAKEDLIYEFGEDSLIVKYDYDDESNYYGNLHALVEYAGISYEDEVFFPKVNHNNSFPVFTPFFNEYATIVQGNYYVDALHKYRPYLPVFSVGPYIYYATEIINDREKEYIKKSVGRVLTIVLPHSVESMFVQNNAISLIDRAKKLFSDKYDNIWILTYWLDVTKELIEQVQSTGCYIVTAGFRFDPLFNRRLKTILSLSDAILDDRLSTTSCYSVLLNKHVYTIDDWTKYHIIDPNPSEWDALDDYYIKNDKKQYIKESVLWRKTDIDYVAYKKWLNKYAGFDQIRSKEHIKSIFSISKDIWCLCEGNLRYYTQAVQKTYRMYYMDMDFDKMLILKNAVGAYIDQ